VSMMSLRGLVGFRPRHRHPQGKHHCGQSVLLSCRSCSGREWAPVLRHLGERWLKLPFLLDAVRNSSGESSIMARCGVQAPLRVEPTKTAPSLPLLG
jgi:hypothetical protein